MSGSPTPYGITAATGAGDGITADNIQMANGGQPLQTKKKCYDRCRSQGGTWAYCRGKCGMAAAG